MKCRPTLVGIITSVAAVSLMLFPEIVRSVPSPSIFSPSSPNVRPMSAGILISPFDPTLIEMSVPSDSIFSAPEPSSTSPVLAAKTTSAEAVNLILLPVIVKSVPSPSIFSASSPNVIPTPDGMFTSAVAVRLI